MKNINFQRGNSMLRVWEQDQKSKIPFNWDRMIYLVLLVVALFFFIRYIYTKTLYIQASGQVIFENVNIMNTDDSRILEFYVAEGDQVSKGDSLFTFFEDEDAFARYSGNGGTSLSLSEKGNNNDWVIREIYSLSRQIAGNQVRLRESRAMLEIKKNRLEKTRNEVILDLLPQGKLLELEEEVEELQFEIEKLEGDIRISRDFVNKLNQLQTNPSSRELAFGGIASGAGDDNGIRVFYSPLGGTVTKINFQPFEVAVKSEVIMSVHKPENIFIKAFFDQEDLDELHEGDLVSLTFPDGTESKGVIRRFYFATNTLPEEFQKKYEPTTRSLVADIYPFNEDQLNQWKAFYKMSVQISKYKY